MITDRVLIGKNSTLRQIELSDCTPTYVKWLNDPDVNQYLEIRWIKQDLLTVQEFVESQRKNEHSILFAIISNETNIHIGNIKIGPINKYHKHADISYLIGNKVYWNKGIATEVIGLICDFGFTDLKLNRIEAGAYQTAKGSWKALEKNGFKREGIFRQQALLGGVFVDVFRYGLLKSEWLQQKI